MCASCDIRVPVIYILRPEVLNSLLNPNERRTPIIQFFQSQMFQNFIKWELKIA